MPYNTREKRRQYLLANRDMIRKQHTENSRIYRGIHPEVYREGIVNERERNRQRKLEVLTYYGNGKCGCVKCGEARLACLTIDHLNGRKEAQHAKKKLAGRDLYIWLKVNGLPNGYQTLCMNCQWVKRIENGETGGGGH